MAQFICFLLGFLVTSVLFLAAYSQEPERLWFFVFILFFGSFYLGFSFYQFYRRLSIL